MDNKELKVLLDNKFESYILIGQKEEFKDTDMLLHAYSLGIVSLFREAFKKYPPLKKIIKSIINENK